MLCAGIGLAAVFGDYLLMALFLIIAPAVFSMTSGTTIKLTPLSRSELAWLAAGYVATFTYYVAVALKLWNETPVFVD